MSKTKISEFLDIFELPKTKIIYEALGVPEPQAWKYIVVSSFPLGLVLVITSIIFSTHTFPALDFYGHPIVSFGIGILFLFGSFTILHSWYGKKGMQSQRVLREISGSIFLGGAFLSVFFCGIPSFPHVVFVFFICVGCSLGSLYRAYQLIKNHFKLLKIED